jgi:hypothetical protein
MEEKMDIDDADSPPPSAQHTATTTPTSATGPAASAPTTLGLEAKYSCVVCHRRKVKCDRLRPCTNCVRNAVDCDYKAPPPARRGKKKSTASGPRAGSGGGAAGPFTPPALPGGADTAVAAAATTTPRGARKYEEQRRRSRVFEEERGERASTESSGLRTFADGAEMSVSGESARGEVVPAKVEEGTLLVDGGKSRYLEK